jgi:Uma2 family endonuclease
MLVKSTPAEQRTVLYNVSWETFEALLRETGEDRGSRFAYDCGVLEIMTPLFEHENLKSNFGNFIKVWVKLLCSNTFALGCEIS